MATVAPPQTNRLSAMLVEHLLDRIESTPAHDEPFSHFYIEGIFPDEFYAELIEQLPAPDRYKPLSAKNHRLADGTSTRDVLPLHGEWLGRLSGRQAEMWTAVSSTLTDPRVKQATFGKLATDLMRRFGCERSAVSELQSFTKPSLFRDLEGYEIAPHTDGRAKIVTMQLYLPADRSQIQLGTALYERRLTSLKGLYTWHGRFKKVKQFQFLPNSGYAFAVSNSLGKRSWHGREHLPPGSGVRHSILNLFFAEDGREY